MVRSAEKGAKVKELGAMPVVGDLDDPASLTAALDGVDRVFLLASGPTQVAQETAVIRAAADAGASIVKLSVVGADPDSPVMFAAVHGQGERVLAESGVPHTLLRANDFMQNSFGWAAQIPSGSIATANADDPIASIDVSDIAAAAVAALTGDGHEGKVYELSGPEALTRRQQIAVVAAALGREIAVVPLTPEQAKSGMIQAGYPAEVAEGLRELMELVYQPGYAAGVTDGVLQATGRSPRGWREFADDHAAVWQA